MKILDIKNNLVKISYTADEILALGSFIVISDSGNSYVAQIVNLKTEQTSNSAIARLILTFNDAGILDNYDGAIPSVKAEISKLEAKDLLGLLPVEKPVILGEIAQQHQIIRLDEAIYEKRLLICAEKFNDISVVIHNAINQLNKYDEKVVVVDIDHTFDEYEPIKLKKDFRLPLNSRMIDFIYENELNEIDPQTKAVIQDILLEVQNYAKTVEFIPFESFINVVAQQYEETKIPELALLKNKLLKYDEENIFAQKNEDYTRLQALIRANKVTFIDIAGISDELQKEVINYLQQTLEDCGEFIYNFVKINNRNSDKKTLLSLTNGERVFTSIICNHAYKYVSELKQLSENIILFAPQTTQHDFAPYNTFLSKLNVGEFIVYGDLTQNIPFIVEAANVEDLISEEEQKQAVSANNITVDELQIPTSNNEEEFVYPAADVQTTGTQNPFEIVEEPNTPSSENPFTPQDNDNLVEQVAKEVDETFISNKIEDIQPIDNLLEDTGETLTEEDLDFLEELPSNPEFAGNDQQVVTEEANEIGEEQPLAELEPEINEVPTNNFEPEITEEPPVEAVQQEIVQEPEIVEELPEQEPEISETTEQTADLQDFPLTNDNYEEAISPDDLPVFPTEEVTDSDIDLEQGDTVSHPKYGKGVVEKLIKYGNKTLCSIAFEEVGRRLLDPTISEFQKLS